METKFRRAQISAWHQGVSLGFQMTQSPITNTAPGFCGTPGNSRCAARLQSPDKPHRLSKPGWIWQPDECSGGQPPALPTRCSQSPRNRNADLNGFVPSLEVLRAQVFDNARLLSWELQAEPRGSGDANSFFGEHKGRRAQS